MQYDPIKHTLGKLFNRTPFLRKLFYRLLDLLLRGHQFVDGDDLILVVAGAESEGDRKSVEFILSNISKRMAEGIREDAKEKKDVAQEEFEAAQLRIVASIRNPLHVLDAAVMGADRFLSEIRTTANLQHPHILPLFDSGEAGGFLFFVMPFVEGESLEARLDREKQLGVEDAVRLAREVAEALHHAHKQGVIPGEDGDQDLIDDTVLADDDLGDLGADTQLIGSSQAMRALKESIARVADIPSPVLIVRRAADSVASQRTISPFLPFPTASVSP